MWFDLITWSGHLMVHGDMGTYVFRRTEDMFGFFRMHENDFNYRTEKNLNINPGYWAEKLCAVDNPGGYKKFDEELFRRTAKEWFDCYYENHPQEEKKEAWEKVKSQVLSQTDSGYHAMDAAMSFSFNGKYPFQDFWEVCIDSYTYHFIWCLYAIVWGIQQYDKLKQELITSEK